MSKATFGSIVEVKCMLKNSLLVFLIMFATFDKLKLNRNGLIECPFVVQVLETISFNLLVRVDSSNVDVIAIVSVVVVVNRAYI